MARGVIITIFWGGEVGGGGRDRFVLEAADKKNLISVARGKKKKKGKDN